MLQRRCRIRLNQEEYLTQRQKLFDSFDWRCAKCGKLGPLQRDHIRKRSQGGGDEIENAQPLCPKCHEEKDNVARGKSKYWN
jgi:5-methylcytosine-specific restriction endonuclease McrA